MIDLLRILAGPLVWLAAFTATYGLHGLVCGHSIQGTVLGLVSLQRLILVSAYLLATAVMGLLLWGLYLPRLAASSPIISFVSRVTGWTGLVAVLWSLVPTATTTYCQ